MNAPADELPKLVDTATTSQSGLASGQTARAAMWAAIDTLSQTFVSVLSFLIVARLLGPQEFGIAAMSFGIVQILNLFVETLLQDALVQRQNLTPIQISSAFWWSLVSGSCAMLILIGAAPLFALFLKAPLMTPLLRTMSVGLLFTGAGAVPIALLRRSLLFRTLTTCSVITRIITGCSSAGLAFAGAGAFSLVAQTTLAPVLLTGLVFSLSGWRPAWRFSLAELRTLLVFGIHVVGSQIVWLGGMRLYIVCIGLIFSPTAVGFYNIAQRVIDTSRDTLAVAISNLALPVFSRHQNDHSSFNHAVSEGTELIALLILPIFAIIGGCATPLVHLILTDKWMAAVPIIRLFAAGAMLHMFRFLQTPAITAAGRPDLALLVSVFSTGAAFLFLATLGHQNFMLAAAGWAFLRPLITFPFGAFILQRLIGLRVLDQVKVGMVLILGSVVAFACSYQVCTWMAAHHGLSPRADSLAIALGTLAGMAADMVIAALGARWVIGNAITHIRSAWKRAPRASVAEL